jgi:hypothetical protein
MTPFFLKKGGCSCAWDLDLEALLPDGREDLDAQMEVLQQHDASSR